MKKFTPPTTFMNSEIIYTDQNIYLHQAVNMFISAVKFHILTWGLTRFCSQPQAVIRGTAVCGTSLLSSLLSTGVCPLVPVLVYLFF